MSRSGKVEHELRQPSSDSRHISYPHINSPLGSEHSYIIVSYCLHPWKSFPPSLVDVLHLIGVVSHARKIDQRQLRPLLANHANVQGLQAQDLQAQDSQPAGSNLQNMEGSNLIKVELHHPGIQQLIKIAKHIASDRAWLEMNWSPMACLSVRSLICCSTCGTVHFFALAEENTTWIMWFNDVNFAMFRSNPCYRLYPKVAQNLPQDRTDPPSP